VGLEPAGDPGPACSAAAAITGPAASRAPRGLGNLLQPPSRRSFRSCCSPFCRPASPCGRKKWCRSWGRSLRPISSRGWIGHGYRRTRTLPVPSMSPTRTRLCWWWAVPTLQLHPHACSVPQVRFSLLYSKTHFGVGWASPTTGVWAFYRLVGSAHPTGRHCATVPRMIANYKVGAMRSR
jgi:hypothetical protein